MTLEHQLDPSLTPTPGLRPRGRQRLPLDVGEWGTRSGLAVYEEGDQTDAGCAQDTAFGTGADVGFAATWSDTRREKITPRVTDTFIRSFEWE